MAIFKKIKAAVRNRTTYRVGLLQAKVYRILKNYTGERLAPYGISTIEWALLGLLYDNVQGLRASHLAEELGVEASFITVMCAKLKKKNLLATKTHEHDTRVKITELTSKGKEFVVKMEAILLKDMKVLVKDVPKEDVMAYIAVLEGIIENGNHVSPATYRHGVK